MRILIVDSSIVLIQRLISLVSESINIEEIEFSLSYEEAIEKIKNTVFNIVLIDLSLPENKSIEFVRKLKQQHNDVSIIALSDLSDQRMIDKSIESGADIVFDKYNEFEKIPGAIKNIVSLKKENPL